MFVGLCCLSHPHFMYILYKFNLIQFIFCINFIIKKENEEGILDLRTCHFGLADSIRSPF